ncbi:hypothetical protein PMIN03_007707 [Paraphaeosphaeria minitans]
MTNGSLWQCQRLSSPSIIRPEHFPTFHVGNAHFSQNLFPGGWKVFSIGKKQCGEWTLCFDDVLGMETAAGRCIHVESLSILDIISLALALALGNSSFWDMFGAVARAHKSAVS